MRAVDAALFAHLEDNGFWVPVLHQEEDPIPEQPADTVVVHDGLVRIDNTPVVVTLDLPYIVYHSSIGDDDNPRLTGRKRRRSVFFSLMYVGEDRNQAKWAGELARNALQGKRIPVSDFPKTWLCGLEESQRVRRDDDAIRPDGSPLFYGVDDYAVSVMLTNPTP